MFAGCLSHKAHHFKGRDQCEIPQFKAGEKEAIAQTRVRQIIIYGCSTFKRSSDMLGIKEYDLQLSLTKVITTLLNLLPVPGLFTLPTSRFSCYITTS